MIGWRLAVLLAVLALAGGLWGGDAWRKGQTAIEQNKTLKDDREADRKAIADLKETAEKLRQHGVDNALAYDQAMERMGAIAEQLEKDREANRQFEQQQRQALADLLADRPDLRDLRLGDDVLRHWQQSNQGRRGQGQPATPAAAPAPAGKPAKAVPGAAGADKRRGASAAGEPRPGDRAVPRLQRSGRLVGAGDGRMAHHRMAVVLQGGGGNRPPGYRLPG